MLVLSRKVQEQITIGDNIIITITGVKNGKVSLGIEAPRDMLVLRAELTVADEAAADEPPSPGEQPALQTCN